MYINAEKKIICDDSKVAAVRSIVHFYNGDRSFVLKKCLSNA